jgi:hypothetical protein
MLTRNAVASLTIPILITAYASSGQAPSTPEFEVASVHATPRLHGRDALPLGGTRSGGPGTSDPERIVYARRKRGAPHGSRLVRSGVALQMIDHQNGN